jgi:hypothetical protein
LNDLPKASASDSFSSDEFELLSAEYALSTGLELLGVVGHEQLTLATTGLGCVCILLEKLG